MMLLALSNGLVRMSEGLYFPLHDRKRELDKDELAKVAPWRKYLHNESACRTGAECCDVCRVCYGHEGSAEDLQKA
jgi:hypothetical protein